MQLLLRKTKPNQNNQKNTGSKSDLISETGSRYFYFIICSTVRRIHSEFWMPVRPSLWKVRSQSLRRSPGGNSSAESDSECSSCRTLRSTQSCWIIHMTCCSLCTGIFHGCKYSGMQRTYQCCLPQMLQSVPAHGIRYCPHASA